MAEPVQEIVRRALELVGGNRSELARQIGVEPPSVARWEAGDAEPRGQNLVKLNEFVAGGRAMFFRSDASEPVNVAGEIVRLLQRIRALEDLVSAMPREWGDLTQQQREGIAKQVRDLADKEKAERSAKQR